MATLSLALIFCVSWFGFVQGASTCGGLQGDVVFLLDASGSVTYSNFQTMLTFVSDLVDDFDIGIDNVRVGVATFSSDVFTEFHLHDFTDKSTLKNVIMSITYAGDGTATDLALEEMTTSLFTASNGDRSAVPNVGIVITDGASNSPSSTATAAQAARNSGIVLFSIGIGTGLTELQEIASDPDADHVFSVQSFSGLLNILGTFQGKACTAAVFQQTAPVVTAPVVTVEEASNAGVFAGIGVGVTLSLAILAGAIIYVKVFAGKGAVASLVPITQVQVTAVSGAPGQNPPKSNVNQGWSVNLSNAPGSTQPLDTRLFLRA